ncbi:MAG: segregation/condensation protein A [Candidatus Micrarchaeia archaeon]
MQAKQAQGKLEASGADFDEEPAEAPEPKPSRNVSANDIERMVLKPTWKEMLLEMIASERLDPWNIDITVLANGFLKRIKNMKDLELHVPANVILAAAILLKYKSNVLNFAVEAQPEEVAENYAPEEIPQIELVSRIPPKGPITMEDLMREMEKVIKYDNPAPPKLKPADEIMNLPAPKFDIEERMDSVFTKVKGKVDGEGWTTFSQLLDGGGVEEMVYTLLPLLHLCQRRMVDLKQDEFFGEIFVKKIA